MKQIDPSGDEELADYLYEILRDREVEDMELRELEKELSEATEQKDEALNMLLELVIKIDNLFSVPHDIKPEFLRAKEFLGLDEHE